MEIGATFPQTEIDADPSSIREYAETVEALGYDHVLAYDHVLGVKPPHSDWDGAYDYTDQFIEPFVLFSHLAAVTTDLRLFTGVLVLPQRETPLVAKQAATLDVLSDGRFVLGAGVGWNDLEYRNLGKDFHTRGARIEEQISLLRALWQRSLVDFDGEWHRIEDAGINPLPIQRPIPIWLGGGVDAVLERIARQADGWIAPRMSSERMVEKIQTLYDYLRAEGRNDDAFPVDVRLAAEALTADDGLSRLAELDDVGVTQFSVRTHRQGLETTEEHLDVLTEVMDRLRDAGFR